VQYIIDSCWGFNILQAAFDALPQATLNAILADNALLSNVLTNHVLDRVATSLTLTTGAIPALNGELLDFVVSASSGVTVNGITVTKPDILANNGVIHELSAVLIHEKWPMPAQSPSALVVAGGSDPGGRNFTGNLHDTTTMAMSLEDESASASGSIRTQVAVTFLVSCIVLLLFV
jgi:hypothetical protein